MTTIDHTSRSVTHRLPTPPHSPPQVAENFEGLSLSLWLLTVRRRGYRLSLDTALDIVHLDADEGCWPVWRDWVMLKRHQHALGVAIARTHPEWWAYASGQSDRYPAPDGIPLAADCDAFACAACGAPADSIDDRAVAHCDDHLPSSGWPASEVEL